MPTSSIYCHFSISRSHTWENHTEITTLGCPPHSRTLYRRVQEELDRRFGLNPTTNISRIGSQYRNGDFRLSPILTHSSIGMHGEKSIANLVRARLPNTFPNNF